MIYKMNICEQRKNNKYGISKLVIALIEGHSFLLKFMELY